MTARGLTTVVVALTAGGLGAAVPAPAAPPPGTLGAHVSECARTALGERANPPQVTCVHDGHEMTFDNFGDLVAHMRLHHGK